MEDNPFDNLGREPDLEQGLDLPMDPALPEATPAQTPVSQAQATEQRQDSITSAANPPPPSRAPAAAEDDTFLPATRRALEQALGKTTLERLEAILHQEKTTREAYIASLEAAVQHKSSITATTQTALMQKEMALWKARAQDHDESIKTEMKLLRDWNVRIKDERDRLEAAVREVRRENAVLRAGGGDADELERLRRRNARLEEEKDALSAAVQMTQEDCEALKAEMERVKKDVVGLECGQQDDAAEFESKMPTAAAVGPSGASVSAETRRLKNREKKARRKRRRERRLAAQSTQLAAQLAQGGSVQAAAALVATDEHVGWLQAKIEELDREMHWREECAEKLPAAASSPVSAAEGKVKKRRKGKKRAKASE